MADTELEGIGHGHGRSKTMPLWFFAFLVRRCSAIDEEHSSIKFLLAFCNPSHPLARLSLRQSSPNCLVWQFHIRHFAPVRTKKDSSLRTPEGFLLIRQQARMRRMQSGYKAHDKAKLHSNATDMEEQHFEERVLSTSLVAYNNNGAFKLTTVGDSGAKVYGPGDGCTELFRPEGVNSHDIKIGVSGPLEGPTYFLISMFWLFESWYKGWDDTLTLIEQLLIFRVSALRIRVPLQMNFSSYGCINQRDRWTTPWMTSGSMLSCLTTRTPWTCRGSILPHFNYYESLRSGLKRIMLNGRLSATLCPGAIQI